MYPTLHCKVPCEKVPTTAIHRTTQFQDKVQHHATHNHSTRTAVPIRRIVSSSLNSKTRCTRSSSCSGVQSHNARRCVNSIPTHKAVMKFANRRTQIAAHSEWTHEHSSSPHTRRLKQRPDKFPFTRSSGCLDSSAINSRSSRSLTPTCSHNLTTRATLAPKPVVRGGPNDGITCVGLQVVRTTP